MSSFPLSSDFHISIGIISSKPPTSYFHDFMALFSIAVTGRLRPPMTTQIQSDWSWANAPMACCHSEPRMEEIAAPQRRPKWVEKGLDITAEDGKNPRN